MNEANQEALENQASGDAPRRDSGVASFRREKGP